MSAYEAELAAALVAEESNAEEQGDEPVSGQESDDSQADETAPDEGAGESEQSSDDDGEADEEDEPEVKTKDRFRFKDPTDQAIAAIAKAKGISLLDAAKLFEGQNPTKREEDVEQTPEATETVATVSATIKDLQAQKRERLAALEFEAAAEIDEQIDELRDKRDELKISEVREQSKAEQREAEKFYAEFAENEEQAVRFYPDAAKPDSALAQEMKRLEAEMQELGDPLYHSPKKPFALAKEAAKNLGIPMTNPNKPAAKKTVTTRPMQQPASGNARTTATAPTVRQEEAIDRIGSIVDYEKFVAGLR